MIQRRRRPSIGARALVVISLLCLLVGPTPVDAGGPGASIAPATTAFPGAPTATPAVGKDGRPAAVTCASVPGQLLVRFRKGVTSHQRTTGFARVDATRLRSFRSVPGLEAIRTTMPIAQARAALLARPDVVSVEPDCIVHLDQTPNDPQFSQQWALANTGQTGGASGADIDVAAAWDVRTDASSVTVAIIDTGMQLDHPDLAANLWTNPGEIPGNGIDDDANGYVDDVHGWDFVNGDAVPADDNGHGTHIAGTIGARGNNAIGVTGIAWSVQLMPLKAFAANGTASVSNVIAALEYAVENGADISNNSYSGTEFVRAEYDAFVAAGAAGHLAIAAAGNDAVNADESPHYPAAFRLDSIVSVAATTDADGLASFSDYGTLNVQVAAPGQAILSTVPGGTYGLLSGTSMATPHVVGVAALVAAEHPAWSGSQIRDRILGTTRDVPGLHGKTWTGGVIDAGAALSNAATVLPPPPADPTPQPLATTVDPSPNPPPVTPPTPPAFPDPAIVESSPQDLGPARIALDDQGRPIIAYTRRFDGVHLATLAGGTWGDRRLSQAYDDFVWLDLAIDGAGSPSIAVQRFWSDLETYSDPGVMLIGATSPDATVDRLTSSCPDKDTCYTDWNPALAYDAAGAAHAAFTRTDGWLQDAVPAPAGSAQAVTGTGTYYATNAGGDWQVRRLTTSTSDGPVAIASEPDGTVHIVMTRRNGSSSGVYYLTNDGGSWNALQLTDHVEDLWPSVGVDAAGGVHVSFARPGFGLYYLHRSPAGTWTAPVRVYDGSVAQSHLAVDDSGFAHVAFGLVDGYNTVAGVRYVTNRSGSWVGTEVADGQANSPDIAVDSAGHAHISYSQAVGAPLGIYYATNATGSFVSTLVRPDSGEDRIGLMAHAVDSSGHHHIAMAARYGELSAGLYYGTDLSGSWTFTKVSSSYPSNVAMTLDGLDRPHIAFAEDIDASTNTVLPPYQRKIGYATNAGGSWQVQRVSPAGDMSSDGVEIVVDAANKPVILYADFDEQHLLRARLSGTAWTIDTIYSGAASIREPSAVLDPSGVLHVAVIAALSGDTGSRVVYLRGTTGTWTSASVTTGDTWRFYPSLDGASDGTIWIADWEPDHGIWVHKRTMGGSWSSTHLASGTYDAEPSLVVDAADRPHVVFTNGAFYGSSGCTIPECPAGPGLRHALLVDGTWQTTKLSPRWLDVYPAMARGGDGSLSVVFQQMGHGLRALELQPGSPSATLSLQAASDTGTVGDNSTAASTLVFDIAFGRAVTGLTAGDLSRSGTATGCVIGAPSGSGATYTVSLTGCSAGTVVLTLAAGAVIDGDGLAGPAVATKAPNVTIDRTAPTATAPAATLRTGATLAGSSIPVRLSWTASDGSGSGVHHYEVAQSLNGSSTWTSVSASLSTPAANVTVPSSGTVRYRVRAVDRAGNAGAWSTGIVLTPRLTQETSASIAYLRTWSKSTSVSFSSGAAKFATSTGASASYRFSGRSVAIVSTRALTRGQFKVYLDGAYIATVDTHASATAYRVLVYQKAWSTVGTHTIKLVAVGTSGRPRVDLDAIVIVR